MWRTYVILVLIGLLIVSVGGNVLQLQQVRTSQTAATSYRDRLKGSEDARATAVAQLTAVSAQASQEQSATPAPAAQGPAPQRGATTPPTAPAPLVGRTPTPAASGQGTGAPSQSVLARIADQVMQIRGLKKNRDVPLNLLDQNALRQYFVDSFNKDYLPSERESDQKLLVTLGYMKPTDNLVQILLDIDTEQVIGVYDDDQKAMYVVNDQGQFGAAEKVTFAHEYTHDLQDQNFDLNAYAPKHPDNADRSLAVHAVIEGDATLVQRLWMQDNLTQDDLAQLTSQGGSSALDSAPPIVQTELLFPYTDGFQFVQRAYQSAGGFGGVDALFKNPPESTTQILHPDKYAAHEHPVDVAIPDLTTAMGAGWRKIDSNILGELDLRILLAQYGDPTTAARSVTGWRGDRWELLEKDGKQAIVVRTVWDSPTGARQFFTAYGAGLRQRFPGAKVEESSQARQALTTADYATDLRLQGSEVLAVLSFDRPTAQQLVAAVGGF